LRGDRGDMVMFLKIFGTIIRDILEVKLRLQEFVVNVDLLDTLKDASERISFRELEKIFRGIRIGEEGLTNQVNPDVLLSSLLSLTVKK